MTRRARTVFDRPQELEIPVIAAIEGHAVGGGCELALACDMRVAGQGARFSFWQVRNGVTTGWGGGPRLVSLLGEAKAFELLCTGDTMGAEQALAAGLINRLAPDGEALRAAIELATQVAAQPPLAVRALKRLVRGAATMPKHEAAELETELFVQTWLSEDHREAVNAFFAKRSPKWRGR